MKLNQVNLSEVLSQAAHLNRIITRWFLKAPIVFKDEHFKQKRSFLAYQVGDTQVVEMRCRIMFSEIQTLSQCTLVRREGFWEPIEFVLNVDTGSRLQSSRYTCWATRNPEYFVRFRLDVAHNVDNDGRYVKKQDLLARWKTDQFSYRFAAMADLTPGSTLIQLEVLSYVTQDTQRIWGSEIIIDEVRKDSLYENRGMVLFHHTSAPKLQCFVGLDEFVDPVIPKSMCGPYEAHLYLVKL